MKNRDKDAVKNEGGAAVEDAPGTQDQPEDQTEGQTEDQDEDQTKDQDEGGDFQPGHPDDNDSLLARVNALQEEIKAERSKRKVASGSKARSNVVYKLLSKPPQWHDTPQVAQLEKIIFSDDVLEKFKSEEPGVMAEIPEPELFELIKAGHEAGLLQTKQNPVRIFQYYRSNLIKENVLRHQ